MNASRTPIILLAFVCLFLGLPKPAESAAVVYLLTVEGGPSNNQLDANRRATYSFKVKIDPASGRSETNSLGSICLSRTAWWEWVDPNSGAVTSPPRVPELSNMEPVTVQGTIRSKGTDAWTGTRDITFFAKMGIECPGSEAASESNNVTKTLALAPPALASLTLNEAPTGRQVNPGAVVTSLGADQVAAVDFSMTPSDPIDGDKVRLKLTIKNTGAAAIANIPWEMTTGERGEPWNKDTWASSVSPGQEITVWRDWVATAGHHRFDGWVDTKNTFRESAHNRRNNIAKTIDVTVPKLLTQLLDYKEAEKWGAKFVNNRETNECGIATGGPLFRESIVFDCFAGPVLGGKAKPEAFKDFKLKNRWKIERVEFRTLSGWGGHRWLVKPTAGSDDPYMNLLIWADPGSMTPADLEPPNSKRGEMTINVKVWIVGPEGRSPYRIMFPVERP